MIATNLWKVLLGVAITSNQAQLLLIIMVVVAGMIDLGYILGVAGLDIFKSGFEAWAGRS